MLFTVIAVAFVGLVAALAWWGIKGTRKLTADDNARTAALASYASNHGFAVTARDDSVLGRWRDDVLPFNAGFDKSCTTVMRGASNGRAVIMLDYRYSTWEHRGDAGRVAAPHDYAITAIQTDRRYPSIRVSPENLVDRAIGKVTGNEVSVGRADFDRAFTVKSVDRDFAKALLDAYLVDVLMQDTKLAWMISGSDIIAIRQGWHDPAKLDEELGSLNRILDAFPKEVTQADWTS